MYYVLLRYYVLLFSVFVFVLKRCNERYEVVVKRYPAKESLLHSLEKVSCFAGKLRTSSIFYYRRL